MAATHLVAVPDIRPSDEAPGGKIAESAAHRIRLLQEQARILARNEIDTLAGDMGALAVRVAEIAEGGEAYPTGIRELASRIEEDLVRHMKVIQGIIERTVHG